MSLSCTISDIILLIISQNSKKSRDRDHAHLRDYLSIRRLILHIANQCTKFEVSSLSRSRDISVTKNLKRVRESLSSVDWDLLWSTCTPNLKSSLNHSRDI